LIAEQVAARRRITGRGASSSKRVARSRRADIRTATRRCTTLTRGSLLLCRRLLLLVLGWWRSLHLGVLAGWVAGGSLLLLDRWRLLLGVGVLRSGLLRGLVLSLKLHASELIGEFAVSSIHTGGSDIWISLNNF